MRWRHGAAEVNRKKDFFYGEFFMKNERSFKSLIALLRVLEDRGSLELGQREAFAKAITRLEHALKIGKPRAIEKAVNDLARLFLRSAQ